MIYASVITQEATATILCTKEMITTRFFFSEVDLEGQDTFSLLVVFKQISQGHSKA